MSCSASNCRDCLAPDSGAHLSCVPLSEQPSGDPVNSPPHYTWIPGVEVIDITQHLNFCLGNVVKYVLRADHKGRPMQDLKKALTYLQIEIDRRERA